MANINDDIKTGKYKNVYLLFGQERYLRENYRNKLIKALVSPGDNLNFSSFEGPETDINEVISLAMTMPFMSEKRVIIVKDSGSFSNACEDLTEYLSSPSEDTVLIFDEGDVDKRGKNYKKVDKLGGTVEAAAMKTDGLKKWIAGFLARSDKKIRESTIELLIDRVGTDMSILSSELNKLIGYCSDREIIEDEDVRVMTVRNPAGNIFKMIEAIAFKRRDEAISIYYEMLEMKEEPSHILALIERQFRIMYTIKEMNEKKISNKEIAETVGVPEFTVPKYLRQAAKYSKSKLKEILDECVRSDADSKMGKMDGKLAVELLIIRYTV